MATREQARVLEILENMRLKRLVTHCILGAFFIILIFLLLMIAGYIRSTWESQLILGGLDAILGCTIYPLVNHFFPSLKRAKDAESRDPHS